MQFLTATTVSYLRVLFLLTISFYLATDPAVITSSSFVILLGLAMRVSFASIDPKNPLLSVCSVIFATLAISDVVPLMAENLDYFETMVPARLLFFFGLGVWCFAVKGSILSNNLIFTYSFFEMWFNFLIFNNLKDEKHTKLTKFVQENSEQIRKLHDEQIRVVEIEE